MKNKILSIFFVIFIGTFFILNIVTDDKDISYSERRKLKKLPNASISNILNGNLFDDFDEYSLDQFVFRDEFRKIKSFTEFNVMMKKDYNGLYLKDNYIYKIEYPLKEDKVISFSNKMNNIYNNYLKDMNVYYSIVPDKNYYLNDNSLKMDYDKLIDLVKENINSKIKYIDITNSLDLDDYYYTDIHFRQECLSDVVNTLSLNMNFMVSNNYTKNIYEPFYGSYYGQISTNVKPDKLTYLTNNTINNAKVYDIESNLDKVYDISALGSIDSYDVYLGGATPIVEITNTNSKNKKELIIFRDSFASSLAPLLLEGYSKITLIDLRYINSDILSNYINFTNQDVLILYNTTIINNSDMLKVKE